MHAPDTYARSHQLAGRMPQGPGPEIGPAEFATFRDAFGNASSVRSVHFWEVEILSGHRKTACGRPRALGASAENRAVAS